MYAEVNYRKELVFLGIVCCILWFMEYPLRHELVFSLVVGADLKEQKRSVISP